MSLKFLNLKASRSRINFKKLIIRLFPEKNVSYKIIGDILYSILHVISTFFSILQC